MEKTGWFIAVSYRGVKLKPEHDASTLSSQGSELTGRFNQVSPCHTPILVKIRFTSVEYMNTCSDFVRHSSMIIRYRNCNEIRRDHGVVVLKERNVFHLPSVTTTAQETKSKWWKCLQQDFKLSWLAENFTVLGRRIAKRPVSEFFSPQHHNKFIDNRLERILLMPHLNRFCKTRLKYHCFHSVFDFSFSSSYWIKTCYKAMVRITLGPRPN